MTSCISIVCIFSLIVPSLIQCQSGTFTPIIGRLDSLQYLLYYRMITEPDCISACLQYTSPSCYAISYESYGQQCRIITEFASPSIIPNQSFLNWRTYIRIRDS